jgi:hypothetical protein
MLILQIQDQDDVEIRLVAFAENSYPFVKLLYRYALILVLTYSQTLAYAYGKILHPPVINI